ncbi:MAG TPA: BlaI/MecI/CopY family transcriptional regulator [Hyphomonadaceae bacterium]|jgi:predicted transcriptional regulator|nr:BlaI/MecI/CopY family transcriptional regulator [Hyphomonadaceae bacterium]
MNITASESLIMEVLWRAERPLAIEDLQEALKNEGWKDGTVRAFLARMLRKKAVAAKREGKRQLYRPLLPRADYVQAESQGLLDRLFGGEVAPMVAHLAEHGELSASDIRRIKAVIRKLEKKDE